MGLKLNATREAYREFSREASGHPRNVDQMPKLIADGRVPMNVSQLMQRRLDVRNSDAKVKSSYRDNYFDTGDAGVYHPETKDLLIDLDSETLRGIHPNPKRLSGGAWLLGESRDEAFEVYEQIKNKPTSVLIEEKYTGKVNELWMSRKEVKAHQVWKVLARDQGLLNDYADYIFAEGKERFGYDTAMGVFPDSAGDNPKMRAWFVDGLGGRSDASGGFDLGSDGGRFVGVASETQE